jgi:hypothetical protein
MKRLLYVIAAFFILAYVPTPAPSNAASIPAKHISKAPEALVVKANELSDCLTELQVKIDSNEKN